MHKGTLRYKKNFKRESLEKNANYSGSQCEYNRSVLGTLQRHCTENSKQIFPEMKLRGPVPNFHIHVSVSDLYIPTIGPSILLQKIGGLIVGVYKLFTDT